MGDFSICFSEHLTGHPSKLMVCGADLLKPENGRMARRQFKQSILNYMTSDRFAPTTTLSVEEIQQLFN